MHCLYILPWIITALHLTLTKRQQNESRKPFVIHNPWKLYKSAAITYCWCKKHFCLSRTTVNGLTMLGTIGIYKPVHALWVGSVWKSISLCGGKTFSSLVPYHFVLEAELSLSPQAHRQTVPPIFESFCRCSLHQTAECMQHTYHCNYM